MLTPKLCLESGCLDTNSPELPGPPQLGAICVFALAAAVGLAARGRAAEEAASQQQLLYLAEALPNLSAVQMEDLMRVRWLCRRGSTSLCGAPRLWGAPTTTRG